MVQPKNGVSVNSNPDVVMQFGKPHKIGKIPKGLKIKHTGGTHYEIIPRYPMRLELYQKLLNKIQLTPF